MAKIACCGVLASCAVLRSPTNACRIPQGVNLASGPSYPAEYVSSQRVGQVAAKCALLPDRRLSNCKLLDAVGGDGFGKAVIDWLAEQDFRVPLEVVNRPSLHPGYMQLYFKFASASVPQLNEPISGGQPVLPLAYFGPSANVGLLAGCAINPDGRPSDCHLVSHDYRDVLGKPALEWLQREDVRYPVITPDIIGGRRIVSVGFKDEPWRRDCLSHMAITPNDRD